MSQRIFDLIISVSALVLLVPILLPIIILLRFTGEGEIFFYQNRVGKYGKTFKLIKFATMLKDSPNIGTGTVTVNEDPRILPVGRFLRATKINEIPQLVNILIGDMSIIGPRPQTERCFNAFPDHSQEQIKKVRPGLSGVGSIIFRSEEVMMTERSDPEQFYDEVIMPYKGLLEEWYVKNKSIGLYWKCIIITFIVVLKPDSDIAWRLFKYIPLPPEHLKVHISYYQ